MYVSIDKIRSQQSANLFYFKYFTRYVSIYFSFIFLKFKISPNSITILMIIPGIIGAYLLKDGTALSYIFAGILLIFHDILDTADGEVARYLEKKTLLGIYFDNIVHLIVNSALVFFAVIGLFESIFSNYDHLAFAIALFFTFICIFDEFTKLLNKYILKIKNFEDKLINRGISYKINDIFFGNVAFFHLILIFSFIDLIIFNKSFLTNIYIPIYCFLIFYKIFIKLKFATNNFI